MNIKQITGLAVFLSASVAMADEQSAKTVKATTVEPYALKVMQSSSDFLAAAKQFSVSAEVWQELEDENGNLLQFSKNVDLKVHRPNQLRLDIKRGTPTRSIYYNGKTLTVQDHKTSCYGQVDAPETIDAMIEKADSTFAISLPLEDLILSKPFGGSSKKAKTGQYLGKGNVLGVSCHHMAFQSDSVQWQVWVDDGVQPLVRKILIIFQEEIGAPRFTALFNHWDVTTPLGKHLFEFDPPPGLEKIQVINLEAKKPAAKK